MKTTIAIPDQFIVLMEGKPFVLYAGLLHVAQEEGIKELSVSIQQIPSIENGHTAIASARAVTSDGSIFIDIGDASPESVGADKFIPHLLRVASTRAKSRVLRDAYGIAMTSIEDQIMDRTPIRPEVVQGVPRPTLIKKDDTVTERQLQVLRSLAAQLDLDDEETTKLNALSKTAASQAITELSAKVKLGKTKDNASFS